MASSMHTNDLGRERLQFALWFFPAAIVTWGLHEFAHWITGVSLGYDMWITFNKVGLVEGSYASNTHEMLVGMAGPVVTVLMALVALHIIRKRQKLQVYVFLFLALWMRSVAFLISFISHPNDEASVSVLVGLPMWVLPTITVGFLLVLTVLGSKIVKAGWKENVIAYVMSATVTAIIVFSDQLLFG